MVFNTWFGKRLMAYITTPRSLFAQFITTPLHLSYNLTFSSRKIVAKGLTSLCNGWLYATSCVPVNISYRHTCPDIVPQCVASILAFAICQFGNHSSFLSNVSCYVPLKDKGSKASAPCRRHSTVTSVTPAIQG